MSVAVWLLLCLAVALYASSKGRSTLGWFLISMLICPVFAFIIVLLLPRRYVHVEVIARVQVEQPQVMRRTRTPWSRL